METINLLKEKVKQKVFEDAANLQARFPPSQWKDLRQGSGLSPQTILEANIHPVLPREIDRILPPGLARQVESAMAFPYDHGSDFTRYKLFSSTPITDRRGHRIKYYQQEDSPPHLYIPPMVKDEDLQNAQKPLWINEGEKKTLRWYQEGFKCCVAIAGVWNWKYGYSLIPKLIDDFNFPLNGRTVNVILDSDFHSNSNVRLGYLMFANALIGRGAKVHFIVIPIGKDGVKQGLDDYLQSDHYTVKDVLRLPRMKVSLEVLRGFESEFPRLHFPNDELEKTLKDISNGWNPDKEAERPKDSEKSGTWRFNPLDLISSI